MCIMSSSYIKDVFPFCLPIFHFVCLFVAVFQTVYQCSAFLDNVSMVLPTLSLIEEYKKLYNGRIQPGHTLGPQEICLFS